MSRVPAAGVVLAALDAIAVVGLTLSGAGGALAMIPWTPPVATTAERPGDAALAPRRAPYPAQSPPAETPSPA